MALIKRIFRAFLIVLAGLLLIAVGGFLYVQWTEATIGLGGSGRRIVIEHVDAERRMRSIEEDRLHESLSHVPPPQASAPAPGAMAKPAPERSIEQPEQDGNHWTQYRGPGRTGIYAQGPINTEWPPDGPPELWRQQVGGGYASMIVADSLVFTIEQRRQREVVAAYRLEDGHQVWERSWRSRFSESMGGDGPRATPTWDDGRVYALGANGDLLCLATRDGTVLWQRNILRDARASNVTWGMSGSPLIVDELVIVTPGGGQGKSVFAYDKHNGEIRWSALNDKAGYTSPQVATLAGRRQLLIVTGQRVLGASLDTGSLLWSHAWRTSYDANCAQPLVVDGQHVFVSSGYGHGASLLKIVASETGYKVEEVWFNRNMKNKFNSSVLVDDVVYGLDEGILAAVDVWTGERLWKRGRYGYGQLLYAAGHLIVLSEGGDLALVEATPEAHREVVRFESIPGKTWNVPALADGRLLVRNQTDMVAYDLR